MVLDPTRSSPPPASPSAPAHPLRREPPAAGVACADCRHFRQRPGGTPWKRKTGCYHPELLEQKQTDPFLVEQIIPGDHRKLNLRGDCQKFEPRPRRNWAQRLLEALRS